MHNKGNIIRAGTFFQHTEEWSFHSSAEEPILYKVFQCKTQVYFSIWINLNFSWAPFLSQNLSSFSQEFFQNIFSKHPLKHAVPCHNNSIFFLVSCVRISIWTRGVMFHPQMEGKESISPDTAQLPENSKLVSWTFKFQERNSLYFLNTQFFTLKFLPFFSPTMAEEVGMEIRLVLPPSKFQSW